MRLDVQGLTHVGMKRNHNEDNFLMLPDEGIRIRLEVGVLITETGHEILPHPPQEIEAVEAACRRN